ncbi:hypothetical protein PAHAL_2G168400 [Panicum hallii]|uniref:Uncharacterized protein n=1 Tax=Panicum hallii TaxID=206008 RepID=A0A2T8KPF4_9POAL|nr:hypothetical protein PAHAL_2G168400 [Panicum hallii]
MTRLEFLTSLVTGNACACMCAWSSSASERGCWRWPGLASLLHMLGKSSSSKTQRRDSVCGDERLYFGYS